ncbi:hypothetical protein AAFC00_005389 [Neodothiora populina]|uniref:Trafficking protein particle complex subunit 11 n=1 Tax=Neodothiora populina TaxID=2781224 RepID=A0ABR3PKQ7_9PEZI
MESYPEDYVQHNLPLLVLSGLPVDQDLAESSENGNNSNSSGNNNGLRLASNFPIISAPYADQLLDEFLKYDGASQSWSESAQNERAGVIGFKVASIGRTFNFPPRKAVPPPLALSDPQTPSVTHSTALDLHSPLSPLSPTSPIFPDGLMTPLWLAKHQTRIPSIFLSFYNITTDHAHATSSDSALKSDINATKDLLVKSGYKSRYAVILVADKPGPATPEWEDRIAGIRRATGLDPRTALFFLPSPQSTNAIASFASTVMAALQPVCVDYYRDLTKHARRKKGRGYIPPPTASSRGSAHSLTPHAWNVRYEFKLAVFAEFRQEMDVAQRHYESALEELFGPEGDLETTASWSPRWSDCRVLCDIIAFRILRCQIWRAMTASASESWCNYRYRMKDLVDRRGKGTDGYGWQAWEARWAKMMAQLIEMADLPVFRPVDLTDTRDQVPTSFNAIYAPPEKAFSSMDRLPPFHYLHHPGYWWKIVSKHILARWKQAEAIPIEDRTPLDQLSAAEAASRARAYDTYLVPQPHEENPSDGHATYDHLLDIRSNVERAESEFACRGQIRMVHYLRLIYARELVKANRHGEALDMLRPVWDELKWQHEGWSVMAKEFLSLVRQCAVKLDDRPLAVEVAWEMACDVFQFDEPLTLVDDLARAAEQQQGTIVSLHSKTRLSPVSVQFAFMSSEGFVGDSAAAQITIKYNTTPSAEPICLSELRVFFGTNIRSLHILHTDANDEVFSYLGPLREQHDPSHPMAKSLHCETSLKISPGQVRVLDLAIPLREADTFNATGASLKLGRDGAALEYVFSQSSDIEGTTWLLPSDKGIVQSPICRVTPSVTNVLPKPPRMRITLSNAREQYFTNERLILAFEITNGEDDEADVQLEAKVEDEEQSSLDVSWDDSVSGDEKPASDQKTLRIGSLAATKSVTHHIEIQPPAEPSSYTLSIAATYRLAASAPTEPPLTKTANLDLAFVSPFEANYEFTPRLHNEDYPSFFSSPSAPTSDSDGKRIPEGVKQKWALTSRVASFASEALIIESTSVVVNKVSNNSRCTPSESKSPDLPITIESRGMTSVVHEIDTHKFTLEDRRVSALDLSLAINWRRRDASTTTTSSPSSSNPETTTTLLAIPSLAVPHGEPRVLCTIDATPSTSSTDHRRLKVCYTIENPSMHFLSLTLTMEASDEFAFSGPKFHALSMTPMSRASYEFNLLVYEPVNEDEVEMVSHHGKRGRWIWPALRVMDPYFNRALRVLAGGDGVVDDGRGNVVLWIAKE